MRRPARLPVFLAIAFALACGGGGGGPSEVTGPGGPDDKPASIAVTPSSATIRVGENRRFQATVRTASGDVLSGITFRWESSDPSIALVTSDGRATGLAEGSVTVRAIVDDRVGTASLTIRPNVNITAIQPSRLVPGATARILGTGFDPTPAGNRVTIGGASATVTSSTASTIDVTVPDACLPDAPADVEVAVGGTSSGAFPHPFASNATPFSLDAGAMTILRPPNDFCLLFEQTDDDEEYLIGVQSVSENPSVETPIRVASTAAGGSSAALAPSAGRTGEDGGGTEVPGGDSRLGRLLGAHRAAEARLRRDERALIESGRISLQAAHRLATAPGGLAPAQVPQVGDEFTVQFPDIDGNVCTDVVPLRTEVKHVGREGIWVEDVTIPTGFGEARYQTLSDQFDDQVIGVLDDWYGRPTDIDGNGRVVIVMTNELNRRLDRNGGGTLAFVTNADLAPTDECRASSEGEYFYYLSPDPDGAIGPAFSVEEVEELAIGLVAHEVTHVIQFGRRAEIDAVRFMTAWESEGQATFSEEIVGYAFDGLGPERNLGADVILDEMVEINWYIRPFTDLAFYFGFQGAEQPKVSGAPEQCSFVDSPANGPCIPRIHYGGTWSFLRWLVDHFGDTRPDGPQGMHRGLIENNSNGFSSIQQITGEPIHVLLAEWAATLYLDDRVEGLENPRLDFPSWNLADFDQRIIDQARLIPRRRSFSSFQDDLRVRAASAAYFLVNGTRPETALHVRNPSGVSLPPTIQVWVVRTR